MLQRFNIICSLSFNLLNHFLITTLLLEIKPLLEEELRLLGPELLARTSRNSALLDTKNTLEQASHLLSISVLDLQIQEDVPEVDLLGERGQKTFEDGTATLDIAVLRAEFELPEFGGCLNVSVGRKGLESAGKKGTTAVRGGHRVEEEGSVVDEKLGGRGDLLLESDLEEVFCFL